jgi:outer membrane protein TolC
MQSRHPLSIFFRLTLCCLVAGGPLTGCRSSYRGAPPALDAPSLGTSYLEPYDADIKEEDSVVASSISPDQAIDYSSIQYLPIRLEDCLRQALAESKAFRDIGGSVINAPRALNSTFDPALTYTNPIFGEDAALSAFDAEFSQGVFFEKNDRPFNTSFTGDTKGIFQQDLLTTNLELSKLTATGGRFTSRGLINYDDNNQAGNRFFHSWEPIVENEFRQPLLQGAGSQFNRIAGPSQAPGSYNGILIARTNSEMSLTDFERGVRDYIVNVENAYWDLYFAYRELNAQTEARDAAYEVYKNAEADAAEERVSTLEQASAREQYLRFEVALVESMEGRPAEGTQALSGSSGGVFRRNVGVRVAERRLRHLIGMPITDGSLLQPVDQPNTTPVVFDWNESTSIAVNERPETRRQRWMIKQRELQLIAAKNFLQPRLDVVGRHRFRGLGRSLTGGESFDQVINSPNNNDNVSGGLADLATGHFQEWQLGVELRMPVGMRQAHTAVRHAELGLLRERVILKEQERKILLDLSNAVAEVRRSASSMSLAEQRYKAAVEYRAQAAERIERGRAQFDVLLEAQRRVLEAQVQFINAEVENGIAVRNVHVERGTLLNFHGIQLAENESDPAAYRVARRRDAKRFAPMIYVMRDLPVAKPRMSTNSTLAQTDSQSTLEGSVPVSTASNKLSPIMDRERGVLIPSSPVSPEQLTTDPSDRLYGVVLPQSSPDPVQQNLNPLPADPSGLKLPNSSQTNSPTRNWNGAGALLPQALNSTRVAANERDGVQLPKPAGSANPGQQFSGITVPTRTAEAGGAAVPNHLNGASLPKNESSPVPSRNAFRGASIR